MHHTLRKVQIKSAMDSAARAKNGAYIQGTDMTRESMGERIARIRNGQRLSQEALADRSRVKRRTIQNIERNQGSPLLENIIAIATALDISIDQLVFGDVADNKAELIVKIIELLPALDEKKLRAVYSGLVAAK